MGMLVGLVVVAVLLIVDVLALRFGVNSSDGRDWQPHRLV